MEHEEDKGAVAVVVVTPSGSYPDLEDYHRAQEGETVQVVLDAAADKLKLKDTSDWDAYVDGRKDPINPYKSFAENGLCGIVEIEWHKREGGGGA